MLDRRGRTTIEEVVDTNRYQPSGLMTVDPILLEPEELHVLGDLEPLSNDKKEIDEIVHKFTQDRYPEGSNCGGSEGLALSQEDFIPEQRSDMNEMLFAICEELATQAKADRPLKKEDIPRLQEEWIAKCADILLGAPEWLPPLREINHQIPLVDDKKKYNYHLLKCPNSMRKPLTEKIDTYGKAGWWCPA